MPAAASAPAIRAATSRRNALPSKSAPASRTVHVQPPEQRLALGIHVVVHVHRVGRGHVARQDARTSRRGPRRSALTTATIARLRKRARQRVARAGVPRRLEQVALVDDDDVGLFELLLVDVEHLGRERRPGSSPSTRARASDRPARSAARRGSRRRTGAATDSCTVARRSVQLPTGSARKTSGRASRGRAVRPRRSSELKRQQKQPPVISSTGKPWRVSDGRVHEPVALIVGDEPDAPAAAGQAAASRSIAVVLPAPRKPPTMM